MSQREVTEADFRMPEFRYAKVEDYEFREDGRLVRKDRWITGMQTIRAMVGISGDFEIEEVVDKVQSLVDKLDETSWTDFSLELEGLPPSGPSLIIEMRDGSQLNGVTFGINRVFKWSLFPDFRIRLEDVSRWREQPES